MGNPIRPTDDDARQLAQNLLVQARFATLAVLDETGAPVATRIAFGQDITGTPISLISDLSQHTRLLERDPRCSLLVGEPGAKGDPLTHPRLTLQARATLLDRSAEAHLQMEKGWLQSHPKSRLYIGFADFRFAAFHVTAAFLNGGFGKAFILTPDDLGLTPDP